MIKFPKTWKYDGHEGALMSQPKWQTNNAYFYGPKKDMNKAKEFKRGLDWVYLNYQEEIFNL